MKYIISLLLLYIFSASVQAEYSMVNTGNSQFQLFDSNGDGLIKMSIFGFKPNWQWMGSTQEAVRSDGGKNYYRFEMDKGRINLNMTMKPSEKQLRIDNRLTSSASIPLTYISINLDAEKALHGGKLIVESGEAQEISFDIPFRRRNLNEVTRLRYLDAKGEEHLSVRFKDPIDIHNDGSSRIKLAIDEISPNRPLDSQFLFETPAPMVFYNSSKVIPSSEDHQGWFVFKTPEQTVSGEIGFEDWQQVPERIELKDNHIITNGKPQKVWGTNVEFSNVAPNERTAVSRTKFFAKYGINSVRLHKLTNAGWEGLGTTSSASEYDAKSLSRFDYWLFQLGKHGITYGFSPIWDLQIFEGDRKKLIAYDEIVKTNPRKPVTVGLAWFAEDVQDLHIETLINLLNHKNSYTGLTYAQDPALAYVEIQNEENIFFYTFMSRISKMPTYHKMLAEQFSDWLIEKYKNHNSLVDAWGASAINTFRREGGLPGERLEKRNITPVLNPWLYDNHAHSNHPRAKRLRDTAEFLYEKQNQFYERVTQAIRSSGYTGPIVGSNWQAGSKGAHFLNLLSDAQTGIVDRHNYQGGAKGNPGHVMKTGFSIENLTMLGDPGSSLLSVGMQQVSSRPFMFSEWLAVVPSEWAAADTAIIAAYGFGLQGWDMSYHFSSNGDNFTPTLQNGDNKFTNLTPVGIGLYPVLARMVRRGDITEANPIAIRRLSKRQAINNSYDFESTIEQQGDIKSFSGTPHYNALAAGKVLVEFTEKDSESTIENWREKYLTVNDGGTETITSSTGELRWTYIPDTQKGFVEINSKGTQGVIGFTPNKTLEFDDISIHPQTPFSVIMATAKSPTGTLATDNQAILMAISRAHNTGMNIKGTLIADVGEAPVILEPVKAFISLKRSATIHVLDHDGKKTGKSYPLESGSIFKMDTAKDKAIYYLVDYD